MLKKIMCSMAMSLLFCAASAQDLAPMHNDKGQFGYGEKGKKEFAIKAQWDEARPFNEYGVAIVRKGQNFGVIDKHGKPVGKSMSYTLIAPYDGTDLLLVAQGGSRVEDASKIKTRALLCPYGFQGSLSYPINGAKWGLMRKDGTFQIEPKYQEISSLMQDGQIIVMLKNLLGVIDINDREVFEPIYDAMTPINDQGLAAFRKKKSQKWTIVRKDGRTLVDEDKKIAPTYRQFQNDYWGNMNMVSVDSLLSNRELWKERDRLMPVMTFSNSWINSKHPYIVAEKTTKVKKNYVKELAVYDIDGKELVPFSAGISHMSVPSEGIAVAFRDEQCGFYNLNSKTFTPVEARVYLPFKNGRSLSYSSNNDDIYLVDATGSRKSERFDSVSICSDRYIVTKGSRQGLITLTGEEIIPLECLEVRDANEGLYAVRDNTGAFGYLDKDGGLVIPLEYADGGDFFNGYAIASKKVPGTMTKLSGVISRKNEVLVPLEYEKAVTSLDDAGKLNVWVKKDGVFNFYNLATHKLTATKFADMSRASFGTITKDEQGNCGLIVGHEEVIPCSLANEDMIAALYSFMQDNGIKAVTSSQARSMAISLNPDRNKFKLSEKIEHTYWDF
ncbi:MAG: WG repeat-containing protein [Clostridium sp.]|nr:WG repeat-containing protein [Clostridium sp.]